MVNVIVEKSSHWFDSSVLMHLARAEFNHWARTLPQLHATQSEQLEHLGSPLVKRVNALKEVGVLNIW
jgi:hypothetical protein